MTPIHLINGVQADSLPLNDRACQYGDGVFETIAVHESRALCLEEHLQRLLKGCERLSIQFQEVEKLQKEIAANINNISKAVLKIQVTRGVGGRGYQPSKEIRPTRIISLLPFPDYPTEYFTKGVRVRLANTVYSHNPLLAGIKHMNRLEQVLASNECHDVEIAESIMLDVDGNVVEGTRSNIFICKDNKVVTPDLSQCGIEGVVRVRILQELAKRKINCDIKIVGLSELENADEVFLSNSIMGVCSVNQFESFNYENKLASSLRDELEKKQCIVSY